MSDGYMVGFANEVACIIANEGDGCELDPVIDEPGQEPDDDDEVVYYGDDEDDDVWEGGDGQPTLYEEYNCPGIYGYGEDDHCESSYEDRWGGDDY